MGMPEHDRSHDASQTDSTLGEKIDDAIKTGENTSRPVLGTPYQAETFTIFDNLRTASEKAAIANSAGLVLKVTLRDEKLNEIVKDGETQTFTLSKNAADALGRIRDSMYEQEIRGNNALLDAVTHKPAEDPHAKGVKVTNEDLNTWWETPTE